MAWFFLILAGLSEIAWAYGLKMTEGFTHLKWGIFTLLFMFISFALFAKSMKTIPIGTAYAAFTGIGSAGTAILGMLILNEEINVLKIVSLTAIITGIIGLKLADKRVEDNK